MKDDPIRRLLDEQDWGDVYARLVAFAENRCRSKALAKDLAQTAIARIYSRESRWDPQKEPDVCRYLMSVVNMLLSNERRTPAARRDVTMDDPKRKSVRRAAEAVSDPQAFSVERVEDYDLLARRMTLLAERLAGDDDALALLGHLAHGHDTPGDLARVTGWPASTVARVRARVLYAASKVARDLGGDCDAALMNTQEDSDEDETAS